VKKNRVTILKFGSSVLRSEHDLPSAVQEIQRVRREVAQVIAVVSAFGNTTDQLLRLAESVCPQPEETALAALLATGEAASSALLGLALNRAGMRARVLDAVQAGLRTTGNRLDADPIAVNTRRLLEESRQAVVVLPGFVGRGEQGDTTLLGRGGSDFTALFLAHRLKGQCVLLKDVDGLYTSDPSVTNARALRFTQVSYETAARLGGAVVQQKAVHFAAANNWSFAITRIGAKRTTEVGPFADRLDEAGSSSEPLQSATLDCGRLVNGTDERLAVST
jgi:homoserine dehydrogenase